MMINWKTLFDLCSVQKRPSSKRGTHITAKAYLRRGDKTAVRMEKNLLDTGEYILLRGKANGSYPGLLQEVDSLPVREIGEEEILQLCQSVPKEYRSKAVFLMNAITQHELYNSLRDSTLCNMSCGSGRVFRIMNTPIMLNNAMPCIGSGKVPVLYGDFSQIQIEDGGREDMQKEASEDRPDGFTCTLGGYMDCRILDREAVKGLKIA